MCVCALSYVVCVRGDRGKCVAFLMCALHAIWGVSVTIHVLLWAQVRDLLAGVNPENGAAEGSSLAFASPPGTPRRSNSVKPALNRRASLDIR